MTFVRKHIGVNSSQVRKMLRILNTNNSTLIKKIIPEEIRYTMKQFDSIDENISLKNLKESFGKEHERKK